MAALAEMPDQERGLTGREIAIRVSRFGKLFALFIADGVFQALDGLEADGLVEVRADGQPFPSAAGAHRPYGTAEGPFYYGLTGQGRREYEARRR